MNFLIISIFEYSFDDFPGTVMCKFTDVFGKVHYIHEKIPIVSSENIWFHDKETVLPQNGYIQGEIVNEKNGIVEFSTAKPCYIETTENLNNFFVHAYQIINEVEYDLIEKVKCLIDNFDIKMNDECKQTIFYDGSHKILMDYKNKNGERQKAYHVLMLLYKLYREQGIEEKVDLVADVLDFVVGYFGNKKYLVWEGCFVPQK